MAKPTISEIIKGPVAIYTFTNFFGKAASFLLLFVFTNPKYISPSENGLLNLFSNSMLLLMPFMTLGIIHSTSADFFKMEKPVFRNFFTTGLLIPFLLMILAMGMLFSFHGQLQAMYGFPLMFCWLIPLICFLTFCNEQFLGLARNNHQPMVFLKANVSKIILELGLSAFFVIALAWRWEGRVAGILIAYLVIGIYAFIYFSRNGYIFGQFKWEYVKAELIYAVPIIVMQASIFCLAGSDRFFLSYFTNDHNETVGIYGVAATFASVINVLCMAYVQYLFPRIYARLASGMEDHAATRRDFGQYLVIMISGSLLVLLAIPLAYHWLINARYYPALDYVYLLCIGCFLWAITYFFYSFLLYHKEKKRLIILSVAALLVSLTMNYMFISRMGAMGAALANSISYAVVLIITLVVTAPYWKKFLLSSTST